MRTIVRDGTYTFDASASTITFDTNIFPFNGNGLILNRFLIITNVTKGVIIYDFTNENKGGTIADNVLSLTMSTADMSDTDVLQVIYEADEINVDQYGNAKVTLGEQISNVNVKDVQNNNAFDEFGRVAIKTLVGEKITAEIDPNSMGQEEMANSLPVAIASNQTEIPVVIKDSAGNNPFNSAGVVQVIIEPNAQDEYRHQSLGGTSNYGTQILQEKDGALAKLSSDNRIPVENKIINSAIDRISFAKAISGGVDSDWGQVIGSIGAGQTVNQTGGNLVLTAGTTARSETIIRSLASFIGGVRLRAKTILNQRIANNNFFVELVDIIGDGLDFTITSATSITVTLPNNTTFTAENVGQSMYIGNFNGSGTFVSGRYTIASVSGDDITFTVSGFAVGSGTCSLFGWNYYHLLYDGTNAAQAKFDTQRNGYNSGDTTATVNTTATGHIAVITGNQGVSTLADLVVASAVTAKQTVRASRDENVPDDKRLYVQIRMQNATSAPATNTTWTIGLVMVEEFIAQDVTLQDTKQIGNGSPLPVNIMASGATVPVSGTVTVATTTNIPATGQGASTYHRRLSTADTNLVNVKNAVGVINKMVLSNNSASKRYFKLYNKASAPVIASDTSLIVEVIELQPNQTIAIPCGAFGSRLATGISYAITGAIGDTDTTAIGANEVIVNINYT